MCPTICAAKTVHILDSTLIKTLRQHTVQPQNCSRGNPLTWCWRLASPVPTSSLPTTVLVNHRQAAVPAASHLQDPGARGSSIRKHTSTQVLRHRKLLLEVTSSQFQLSLWYVQCHKVDQGMLRAPQKWLDRMLAFSLLSVKTEPVCIPMCRKSKENAGSPAQYWLKITHRSKTHINMEARVSSSTNSLNTHTPIKQSNTRCTLVSLVPFF